MPFFARFCVVLMIQRFALYDVLRIRERVIDDSYYALMRVISIAL